MASLPVDMPAEIAFISSIVPEPSGSEEVVVKLSNIPVIEQVDEVTERDMNESLGLNEQVVMSSGDVAVSKPPRETLVYKDRTLNVSYEIQRGSSKRGRDKLIDSLGFTYNCKPVRTSKTITWTCSVRNVRLRCPATVLQRGDVFMRGSKKHQHFLGQSIAKPDGRSSAARLKNAGSQKIGLGPKKINQDYRIIKHGSKSGMDILRDSLGYTYTFKRTTTGGDKTYWICSVRNKNVRCEATVIQYLDGNFEEGPHEHKHLPAYNIPAKDSEEIPSLRKLREEREDEESDIEDMGSSGANKLADVHKHSYGSTSSQSSMMGSIYLNSTKLMAKRKGNLAQEKKRREHETFLGPQCTINLSKCDEPDCFCQLVHCPFCDPIHFKPAKAGRVQDHLELTHFAHGVQYDDLMIVKCFKECDVDKNFGHYHCVFCPQQIIKRDFYARHMLRHMRNMGVPERLLMLPDSKYPDIINAYGYEIPICKKTKCTLDRDKHFHCPVCSKVCQQRSLTVNHLWRCFQKQQGNTEDVSDGDETELCNMVDEEAIIVHFSHAKSVNDLPLDKCTEIDCCNQKYHCVMCPEEIFIPSYKQHLVVHYMTHWKHRVMYKNYGLMRCFQNCQGNNKTPSKQKFHYHCPICTKALQTRVSFEEHLKACHMLRFGENLIQTKNPVNDTNDDAGPAIDDPVMLQDSIEFLEDQLIAQSKAYSEKKSLEKKLLRMEKRNQQRKNYRNFAMYDKPFVKQEAIEMEENETLVEEEPVQESDNDDDLSRNIEDNEIFQTCTAVLTKRCMKTIWSRDDLQSLLGEVAGKTDTNLIFGDDGKYQLTGDVENLSNAKALIKQSINRDTETSSDEEIKSPKKKKVDTLLKRRKLSHQHMQKAQSRTSSSKAFAKKVLTAAIQKGRGRPSLKQKEVNDTFPYSEIKEIIKATKNKLGKNVSPDHDVKDVGQEPEKVVRGRGRPRKSDIDVNKETNEETPKSKGRGRPRKSENTEIETCEETKSVPRGRGRPRKSIETVPVDTNESFVVKETAQPQKTDAIETPTTVKRGRGRPPKYSPAQSSEPKQNNKLEVSQKIRQKQETKSVNVSPALPSTPKRYGTRGVRKDYAGMNSGVGIIEIKDEPSEDDESYYTEILDGKRKRSSITKSPTSNKRQKLSNEVSKYEEEVVYDSEEDWEPDNVEEEVENEDLEEENSAEEDDDYVEMVKDDELKVNSKQAVTGPEATEKEKPISETTGSEGQVKESEIYDQNVQDEIDYKAELDDMNGKSIDKDTAEHKMISKDTPVENNGNVFPKTVETTTSGEVSIDSNKGGTVFVAFSSEIGEPMNVDGDSSQINTYIAEASIIMTDTSKPVQKFQCSYCDKQFAFKSNLDDHENKHTGSTPYKCEICTKGFPSQSLLMKHKTLVHTSMRPFKCTICHRSFRFMNVLQSHMNTHSKTKYQCTNCNKTFSNQSAQKYHMSYCGVGCTTTATSTIMSTPVSQPEKLVIYTNNGPTEVINTMGNKYMIVEAPEQVSHPSTIGSILEMSKSTVAVRNTSKNMPSYKISGSSEIAFGNPSTIESQSSFEIPRSAETINDNIAINEEVTNIEGSNSTGAVEEIELYACSECNSTFDTFAKAESHIMTAHPVVIVA